MSILRLDKYLGDLGIATRKDLKQIIKAGRISVNGSAVRAPEYKVSADEDQISFDGKVLNYSQFRYFAMNKPAGVLSACDDKKQKTVLDLLPADLRRLGLFPVGRLDKDTTGLLLLTNDGEFAHKVISPKYGISKVYYAETEGKITDQDIEAFRRGLILKDGLECMPAALSPGTTNDPQKGVCYVTIQEGKYHQVRRMLASVGKPVAYLKRISIGCLQLENIPFPEDSIVCELSQQEIQLVFDSN